MSTALCLAGRRHPAALLLTCSCWCIAASIDLDAGAISSSSTLVSSQPQLWQIDFRDVVIRLLISSRDASVSSMPMSPMIERNVVCTSFSTAWIRSYTYQHQRADERPTSAAWHGAHLSRLRLPPPPPPPPPHPPPPP
eukprot:COSAG01_NODE_16022_length_1277_cov_6.318336_1_plen_137_part_10